MSDKVEMECLSWVVDGILFAEPEMAATFDNSCWSKISQWRPTIGGKLLGMFAVGNGRVGVGLRGWSWPIVPVRCDRYSHDRDTWVTGTAAYWQTLDFSKSITPEIDRRQPRYDADGNRISRASRKVAHRVIWCDRNRGVLVTDPLCRVTFDDLDEALAYLETRRNGRGAVL